MDGSESFFGFDTRLPERKRTDQTSEPSSHASVVDPFDALDDLKNLALTDLPEDFGANSFDRSGLLPKFDDPWTNAAVSDLDKIDPHQFFPPSTTDQFSTGFFSRSSSSPLLGNRLWESKESVFLNEKDPNEERITDTLSRLMDEDSFIAGNIRDDFYASLADPNFPPREPEDPMLHSLTAAKSTWGSGSPFEMQSNALWSKTDNDQVSTAWETRSPAESTGGPVAPPKEKIIRATMTLEELEGMIIPKDPVVASPPSVQDQLEARSPGFSPFPAGPPRGMAPGFGPPDPRMGPYRPSGPGDQPQRYPHLPPGMRMPGGDFPRDQRFPPGIHPHQMYRPGLPPPPGFEHMHMQRMRMMNGGPPMGPERHMMNPFPQFPPGFRGPRPMHPMYRVPIRGHHSSGSKVFVNQRYMERPDFDMGPEDNVGWMTEREKEWVIKVQQAQVKTENPYMDDYYNYVKSMKKAARQNGHFGGEQDFIIPARMATEPKEERPNFFEGSLGKVCISSVFNPRKTVDVEAMNLIRNRPLPETTQKRRWFVDPLQKDQGTPKGILLSIEKLYKLIIKLQDFSREIAAMPETQREAETEMHRDIVNMIFGRLLHGTTPETRLRSFCDIIRIRKGREVLRRALPVLFKEQILILVGFCIRAMPVLVDASIDKDAEFSRCLGPVRESLEAAPLNLLVELVSPLAEANGANVISQVIKSKFAMNFLGLLIARGEECYGAEWEGLEQADRDKWTLFMTQFLICLTNTPPTEVAQLLDARVGEQVATHMGRFPFSPEALKECRRKISVDKETA